MAEAVAFTEAELQLLQPVLRIVAMAGGMAAALRLVERFGGVLVYVPHVAREDHDLVGIIGLPALQALTEAYPGEHIAVPMAGRALRAVRNRRMQSERSSRSIRELALAHKMTRRRVQQLMAEGCGQLDDEHPDLFG